jgi:hypothetical protein
MTAIARMVVLDLRTVAPYRVQALLVFVLGVVVFANKPTVFVLALVLLFTSQFAAYPFNIADKADLETLYAVLPLSRRSVLYGHYAWAVALYLATTIVGTTLAVFLAWAEDVPFGARTLITVVTLSWAVFAVNVAIQFPLVIRFGYTRVSVLGTALPLAIVVGTVYRLHLHMPSIQVWLPLLWAAGAVAMVTSAAVAVIADHQRPHNRGPTRDDTAGTSRATQRA